MSPKMVYIDERETGNHEFQDRSGEISRFHYFRFNEIYKYSVEGSNERDIGAI